MRLTLLVLSVISRFLPLSICLFLLQGVAVPLSVDNLMVQGGPLYIVVLFN